jgi:hypothetical protein
MNCREFQEKIDLEFSSGEVEMPSDLKKHLQSCDSCSAYSGELARLRESLERQKFEVLPGELDEITFEKIAQSKRPYPEKRGLFETIFRGFPRWGWVLASAIAAIIVFTIVPKIGERTSTNYQMDESSGVTEIVDEYAEIESDDDLALVVVFLLENDTDFVWAAEELMADMEYDDLIDDLTDGELKALYDKIEIIEGSAG